MSQVQCQLWSPFTHSLFPCRQGGHSLETFQKGANMDFYLSIFFFIFFFLHQHAPRVRLDR